MTKIEDIQKKIVSLEQKQKKRNKNLEEIKEIVMAEAPVVCPKCKSPYWDKPLNNNRGK